MSISSEQMDLLVETAVNWVSAEAEAKAWKGLTFSEAEAARQAVSSDRLALLYTAIGIAVLDQVEVTEPSFLPNESFPINTRLAQDLKSSLEHEVWRQLFEPDIPPMSLDIPIFQNFKEKQEWTNNWADEVQQLTGCSSHVAIRLVLFLIDFDPSQSSYASVQGIIKDSERSIIYFEDYPAYSKSLCDAKGVGKSIYQTLLKYLRITSKQLVDNKIDNERFAFIEP